MNRRTARCVIPGLATVLTLAAVVSADAAPDPFSTCRERLAQRPDDYESANCFYQVASEQGLRDEGARVFEALMTAQPGNSWLPLAYGHLHLARDPKRAERLYRQAADAFKASGSADGELIARSSLRDLLVPLGRIDEATREVERVVAVANGSNDPMLKARAWSVQAQHIYGTGGDLERALRLLRQAEATILPSGSYRPKRTMLDTMALVAWRMGRFDEALAAYRQLDALATAEGDRQTQATVRYNVFTTTAMKEYTLPTPGGRARLILLGRQALDATTAVQRVSAMVRSHSALADLLANEPGGRAAALGHVQECMKLAARARQPYDEAVCSWIEADLRSSDEPRQARAAEVRALDATLRANNPVATAYSARRHMRLSWQIKPRDEAIRDSLSALNAVEALRALQGDASSSAPLFSTWTLDYYWLSGRLLQDGRDGDLPLAFSVTERMRARALLDALSRSRAPRDPSHPTVKEHREALEAIASVQRTLMSPSLDQARRRAVLEELDELERREQEAQRQIALAFPDERIPPAFATLDAVQAALGEDEALLSFQIGLWETYERNFGGGSWLVAVTRHGRTVHRLPDRVPLSDAVPVFAGLLEGGHGREQLAAVRLYRDLLADAVAALPPGIARLVIIPDGALHRLPFDALRAAPDRAPLGAQYELTFAPSATLWLQWRASASRTPVAKVLTFADPTLAIGGENDARTRNAALFQGLRLGRLPYARAESRAIARHVVATEALVGDGASERALKSRDLEGVGILHVAAHAVADEAYPERSAVLLAPGDAKEDGLLQAREIAALDLVGRIVVLSACQTAGGAVLSGEGVLSLARAFFEAGAHAVIGSRWPLRDADAAALFDTFYRHLGRGASLSEALKATQDEARDAGRPTSTWASLVLLGDGSVRPFPEGQQRPPSTGWLVASLAAGLVILLAIVTYKRGLRAPRAG